MGLSGGGALLCGCVACPLGLLLYHLLRACVCVYVCVSVLVLQKASDYKEVLVYDKFRCLH